MKKIGKRLITGLLTLLMLLEMVPLSARNVQAAGDHTDLSIDFDYVSEYLEQGPEGALADQAEDKWSYSEIKKDKVSENVVKILNGDLKLTGGKFREHMESNKDQEYIILSQDVELRINSGDWLPIEVKSDKILDLNGFTLTWWDATNKEEDADGQSTRLNDHYKNKAFIHVRDGATLTIIDSATGNGKMVAGAQMIDAYKDQIDFYTQRDLFIVDGNLVIYGGTFEAGRQKDQWKSKFTWDKLFNCVGNAVTLGMSIAEYAYGIKAAQAVQDDIETDIANRPPKQNNTSDTGESAEDTATRKPNGQGGTQNQTVQTPASAGGNTSADRAQTITERTETANANDNNKPAGQNARSASNTTSGSGSGTGSGSGSGSGTGSGSGSGSGSGTGSGSGSGSGNSSSTGQSAAQTGGQNNANAQGTAKEDKESLITEAEKGVVTAALDKEKIMQIYSDTTNFITSVASMIGNEEGTRITHTIHGTVAKVNAGGTLVVYGGTLKGHGSTEHTRNATIEIVRLNDFHYNSEIKQKNKGGRAYIFGGIIEGYAGANCFNMVRANTELKVLRQTAIPAWVYEDTLHLGNVFTPLTQELKDTYVVLRNKPLVYEYKLPLSETNGLEVLHYENQDQVVADNSITPIPIDTSNVVVRGGILRCYYETRNVGVRIPEQIEADPNGDVWTFTQIIGTPGSVNLGVESFGEDMIRDGRIQLNDVYGDGTLVLMDEKVDEAHPAGLKHYRLYCGDTELRHIRYLDVYPMNAGANATHSFSLQTYYGTTNLQNICTWNTENDEENEHTAPFAGDEYFFDYEYDARDARDYYVMPNLSGAVYDTSMRDSEAWYYPEPVDSNGNPISDFSYSRTFAQHRYKDENGVVKNYYSPVDYMKDLYVFEDGDYDDIYAPHYVREKYDAWRHDIKWFRYRVYRVDPITRENISEGDTWGVDEPLAEVVYGIAEDEAMRCKLDLYDLSQYLIKKTKNTDKPWTGFKSGEMYRIVLNVDEYVNYGYTGSEVKGGGTGFNDPAWSSTADALHFTYKKKTIGNDWSYAPYELVGFNGEMPVASTESSVLFRCSSVSEQAKLPSTNASSNVFYDTDYTPLQFDSYAILAGEDATINFMNAKVSQADNAGNDFIDTYYQWYISDDPYVDRDPSDPTKVTDTLLAGMTNINMDWNTKSDHKPEKWNPAADKYDYRNSLAPDDPHYVEYGEDGLHDNPEYWTMYDLHAYTSEMRQNQLCMKPGTTGNLTMQNNNPFAFNTDSCYIPKEAAGKYLYVKAVVVNAKEEYTKIYDKKQVFYSHPMLIIDASMLTPKNQQPAMDLSYVSGNYYHSKTVGYNLGSDLLCGFTGATLPETMKKAGFEVRLTHRIETDFNPHTTLYNVKNGNTVNLKNYITKEGLHKVYQTQELYYKRPYWSDVNGFKEALYKEELIATRTDVFPVYAAVNGADGYIDYLSAVGIGTPIIGKAPSTINTVICDNPGAYVYDVEWQIYDPNSYSGWILMQEDDVFEEGKRYLVTLTFKTEDGHFFPGNYRDLSAYINGQEATVVWNPYSADKAYVDMEFTPVSNPAFTKQPESGNSILDDGLNVNWELNFTPVRMVAVKLNSRGQILSFNAKDLDVNATSEVLKLHEYGYVILAFYNDNEFVQSKKITVTRKAPYTATSTFTVGGKMTVDTERMAEYSDFWMEAYLNGEITYQWYRGGSAISGATGESYTPTSADVSKKIYAKVSKGSTTLDTPEMIVTATAGLDVRYIGKAAATVNGNTVTVSNANACKLGYLGIDGKYVTFKATKNANGTYTYTVPDGVSKVILGVKGDITGDNRINVADVSKAYAHAKGSTALTGDNLFIADITGDNRINVADVSKAYAHAKGSSPLTWDT